MKLFFNSLAFTSAFLAFALSAKAAETTSDISEAPAQTARPACCAPAEAPGQFTDKSIYQAESKWKTDAGKEIHLGDLAGRPQIVVMFFASCHYACPMLLNDVRRIEAALPADLRAKVGVTLVSFDTKRDTPHALAEFRQTQNLPKDHWTLLSGTDDNILELAALLGVRYKQDATGQFMHSNLITILDAKGEIVHQQVGLNQDVTETVRTLKQLSNS